MHFKVTKSDKEDEITKGEFWHCMNKDARTKCIRQQSSQHFNTDGVLKGKKKTIYFSTQTPENIANFGIHYSKM